MYAKSHPYMRQKETETLVLYHQNIHMKAKISE